MMADKTGKTGPSLPVPTEEEAAPAAAAPGAAAAAPSADDPFADPGAAPTTVPPSEFNDAVAIQIPSQVPSGARKPYFIFGDGQNSVDLWFFDLGRTEPLQFTGRGSADIAANDTGDLTGVASYDQGEWSVIFKRPLAPDRGCGVCARRIPAHRLLGVGRVLAGAWQPARALGVVLDLRRARKRPLRRRPNGHDGVLHSRHRAGRDRLGAALRLCTRCAAVPTHAPSEAISGREQRAKHDSPATSV